MAIATAQIHLRTPPKTKSLLNLAADLSGAPNLTDYILRAAIERAQSDLSNQQTFALKKARGRNSPSGWTRQSGTCPSCASF